MSVNACSVSQLRHSLLQPTSAIGLILKSAAEGKLSADSITQTLEVAARAAQELHLELENLMNFLVLEYGKSELMVSSVNLHDAITEAASEDPVLTKYIDRLAVDTSPSITMKADRHLLLIALRALIKNAVEFSSTPVEISMHRNDSNAQILIEDRGPGIHGEIIERLGEPFLVAEIAGLNRASRIGIGLPSAKRVADRHGGKLEINTRSGGGTTARLTLPFVS